MIQTTPRRVAIVGATRIPFARAFTAYAECSNQDLMTATLKGLVEKYGLKGEKLGDVGLGAVIKHTRDFNLARESVLGSGLDPHTPAFDHQRALDGCRKGRDRDGEVRSVLPQPVEPLEKVVGAQQSGGGIDQADQLGRLVRS